jgi:hypothetical protein
VVENEKAMKKARPSEKEEANMGPYLPQNAESPRQVKEILHQAEEEKEGPRLVEESPLLAEEEKEKEEEPRKVIGGKQPGRYGVQKGAGEDDCDNSQGREDERVEWRENDDNGGDPGTPRTPGYVDEEDERD